MKTIACYSLMQAIHRAFRTGNVFMILQHWKNDQLTVHTLDYGRTAHLVAQCAIALETADRRLDLHLRAELELIQASHAITALARDITVSPWLVDALYHAFYRVQSRLDQPTLQIVPYDAATASAN